VKRRTKLLAQVSAFLILLSYVQLSNHLQAKANSVLFESFSPLVSTNPEGLRNDHHLRNMDVYVYAANPDLITIKLTFAGAVGPTTFSSNNLQLRLKILPTLTDYVGNAGHLWLDAPKIAYQGSKRLPVAASAYLLPTGVAGSPRKDVSSCGATTWMDDVPNQNIVSFELSRNCFDLTNTLYVIAYIEEDIYNNVQTRDSKYVPTYPMFLDMSNIPRPPKVIPKINQTISASTAQREYFVDNNAIQVVATSSGGAPLSFNSRTPEICFVTATGLIQPKSAGSCQVVVESAGNVTVNPAPPVLVTVNLIRKSQIIYFNPPSDTVYMSKGYIELAIYSDSGLPVQVVSTSPTVCSFPLSTTKPNVVQLLRPGNCSFRITQVGNFLFNPKEAFADFQIYADPTPEPTTKPTPPPTTKPTPPPTTKPKPTASPPVVIKGDGKAKEDGTGAGELNPGGSNQTSKIVITCVKKGQTPKKVISPNKCPSGYTKKK
jgi:hypothetical protein